jgi:putative oxidoreductase
MGPTKITSKQIYSKILDLVRISLGGILIVKGIYFILNIQELAAITPPAFAMNSYLLTHYIVFAHLAGGICLLIGLMTRFVASFNTPILIGAVFFVNGKGASQGHEVELATVVLLGLILVTIFGGKKWSVDYHLDQSYQNQEKDNEDKRNAA